MTSPRQRLWGIKKSSSLKLSLLKAVGLKNPSGSCPHNAFHMFKIKLTNVAL